MSDLEAKAQHERDMAVDGVGSSLDDLHEKIDRLLARNHNQRVHLHSGETLRRVNAPVFEAAETWPRCITLQTDEDRVFVLQVHRDGSIIIDGPIS